MVYGYDIIQAHKNLKVESWNLAPFTDERGTTYNGLAVVEAYYKKPVKKDGDTVNVLYSYDTAVAMWQENLHKFTLFESNSNPISQGRMGSSNFSMTTRKHVKTFYRACVKVDNPSWNDILKASEFVEGSKFHVFTEILHAVSKL